MEAARSRDLKLRWTQKATLTAVLTGLAATLLVASAELSPVARLVPLAVLAPTLALLVFQFFLDVAPGLEGRFAIFERDAVIGERDARQSVAAEPASDGGAAAAAPRREPAAERDAVGWLTAMLALVFLLGFAGGVPLFTLAYLRRKAGMGWLAAAAFAASVALFTLGIFQETLGAQLWTGRLWSWLDF